MERSGKNGKWKKQSAEQDYMWTFCVINEEKQMIFYIKKTMKG